ncbi:MAG: molybdopterin-guanine dinucleotide biosynthesis protein MobA [Methanocella sp. PtaU1.Bin125]|nr:MAG: molybdopterin-guanine dinucleotide biosynthesis protein MobA [Methanocella sp. PtaU1.Bin125]
MRSGIILAGGRSTRFGGGEKSLRPVNGRPMICHVREAIAPLVDEIIVSVRDEEQRNRVFPYLIDGHNVFVYDELRDIGPLAGVLPSLKAARGEYVVIVACDMPLVNTRVIELLFEKAKGHEAAVPVGNDGFIEPLHAVYRREPMVRAVETAVSKGERRIAAPLKHLRDVVYVTSDEIRIIDPELKTFLNVNRAEDLPG